MDADVRDEAAGFIRIGLLRVVIPTTAWRDVAHVDPVVTLLERLTQSLALKP